MHFGYTVFYLELRFNSISLLHKIWCKYKRCTQYGVSSDIVAYMVATMSSTSSIILHYPSPLLLLNYETILNTIRMEPCPFLAA